MKTFEGERSLIEERSSVDAFRFTSNLESKLAEEGVPPLKYLDDLYDDKTPGSSATNDTRDVQEQHKSEEDVSESGDAACGSVTEQESEERKQVEVEVEEEKTSEGTRGFAADVTFDLGDCDSTRTAETALRSQGEEDGPVDGQRSPGEPSHPGEGAESAVGAHSDRPDELPKPGAKPIAKLRLHHRRGALERKMPMRSSLRTCKKVFSTKLLTADEETREPSKKHFCLYCKVAFTQLEKHLEKRHLEETEVAHAVHFPKGSKVRQSLLEQIRNKGDYEHKCDLVKSGVGKATAQQKTPSACARDFQPCRHCFAFYRKTELWRHEQSCRGREGGGKSSETAGKGEGLPLSESFAEGCGEIISTMYQDDVAKQVRNDALICKYGHLLYAKYGRDRSQFAYIAQKMRELGRLVLAVRELDNSVKYLHEICVPSRFELAVAGAKKMGGFDPSTNRFKTVSLISKIGYSLKRATEITARESRLTGDGETESQLKKFTHLLDTKWSGSFSPTLALAVKREVKRVDVDKSTVTEDLMKLHRFITGEEAEASRGLRGGPSLATWKKLSEATLADICLFNRGRVGNIGRMLLQTYAHKKQKGAFVPSADQAKKNTKLELSFGAQFTRLEMEGQYGRNTLVLLTERMVSAVDLLVEHRERAGVSKTNPYLFARTEGPSFIRGLDCFRRAAVECGVKNPEALLSSCLREQIACCWQLLSLDQRDSEQVASLVGLSGEGCRRLSEQASQLEEISKRLLKLDRPPSASPPTTAREGKRSFSLVAFESALAARASVNNRQPSAPSPRSHTEVGFKEKTLD